MTSGSVPNTFKPNAIQRCIERQCQSQYALDERLYVCRRCGGLLGIEQPAGDEREAESLRALWRDRLSTGKRLDRSGVWRFRELLPFTNEVQIVTLAEGNTPLYEASHSAKYCRLDSLQLKHQGLNPTGSFKDTGMTVAITQARLLNSSIAVCASTGNTAASLAAYAARAKMLCAILVPAGEVSQAKLAQALDYGARVIEVEGNFDACMHLMLEVADEPSIYLVNSINPFRIEGQKTVAAELCEQLGWQTPDHVVVPGGNLGNTSAFGKGFSDLLTLDLIKRMPRISVIQAEGAAPFARFFAAHAHEGSTGDEFVNEEEPLTLATAIKIGAPVSWKKALRAVLESKGQVITVSEQEIADAKAIIGRDGIGCEPASATTVAGIRKLMANGFVRSDENVVAVLTGHMLKDTDYITKYHSGTLKSVERIDSRFANSPLQVSASVGALREVFARLQDDSRLS